MSDPTIAHRQRDAFIQTLVDQVQVLVLQVCEQVIPEAPTLQHLEQVTLQTVKTVGTALLTGLCSLLTPRYPPLQVGCPCGGTATYCRCRPAHVQTLLGPLVIHRPYYVCPTCQHGVMPLDDQLGFCAGGLSAGLRELLALLGAQSVFADAVPLVERLSLVSVSPTTIQQATEELGQLIAVEEQQAVQALQTAVPAAGPPTRLRACMCRWMGRWCIHMKKAGKRSS